MLLQSKTQIDDNIVRVLLQSHIMLILMIFVPAFEKVSYNTISFLQDFQYLWGFGRKLLFIIFYH